MKAFSFKGCKTLPDRGRGYGLHGNTDQSGNYEFPSVLPGEYSVRASFCPDNTGAVNSVDAGSVYRWQSEPFSPLEKVRFMSGDVDEDHSLTAGDATLINSFFLQQSLPGDHIRKENGVSGSKATMFLKITFSVIPSL